MPRISSRAPCPCYSGTTEEGVNRAKVKQPLRRHVTVCGPKGRTPSCQRWPNESPYNPDKQSTAAVDRFDGEPGPSLQQGVYRDILLNYRSVNECGPLRQRIGFELY